MTTPSTPPRGTYTVEQAAARLGVCTKTVYAGIRAGELRSIKLGRRLLVPQAWLDAVVEGRDPEEAHRAAS